MIRELRKVKVIPGRELDRLLSEAVKAPLLLQKDGTLFRLDRENVSDDIWDGYDTEKARNALRRTAGAWSDLDADALIAGLMRAREEGSRPASRP